MIDIGNGYFVQEINVPQTPIDNRNSIIIVYHNPTGLYDVCSTERSGHKNKAIALERLKERVDNE